MKESDDLPIIIHKETNQKDEKNGTAVKYIVELVLFFPDLFHRFSRRNNYKEN